MKRWLQGTQWSRGYVKVSRGYLRPFGAKPVSPQPAALKSPVSNPPSPISNCSSLLRSTSVPKTGEEYNKAWLPSDAQPDNEKAEFRTSRQTQFPFSRPPDKYDETLSSPLDIPRTQYSAIRPSQSKDPLVHLSSSEERPHSDYVLLKTSIPCDCKSEITQVLGQHISNLSLPQGFKFSSRNNSTTSTNSTKMAEEYQQTNADSMDDCQKQTVLDGNYLNSVANVYNEHRNENYAEILGMPLSTFQLVGMIREVTPSPIDQVPPAKSAFSLKKPEVRSDILLETVQDTEASNSEQSNPTTKSTTEKHKAASIDLIETSPIKGISLVPRQVPLHSSSEPKDEILSVRHIPPTKIPNPIPKKWINPMVRALTTISEDKFQMMDLESVQPPSLNHKNGNEVKPAHHEPYKKLANADHIPSRVDLQSWDIKNGQTDVMSLSDSHMYYMPSESDMKPKMLNAFRQNSPLLTALSVAPEKPYQCNFDNDIPIHDTDLPTPKGNITLLDALYTAPDRVYNPFNPSCFREQSVSEGGNGEFPWGDQKIDKGFFLGNDQFFVARNCGEESAFASEQTFKPSFEAVENNSKQQHVDLLNGKRLHKGEKYNITSKEDSNTNRMEQNLKRQNESKNASTDVKVTQTTTRVTTSVSLGASISVPKLDSNEIIEETSQNLEHSEFPFPPTSPLCHLKLEHNTHNLHKHKPIPKYQRILTVLSSKSPPITPNQTELRVNIPLAFVNKPEVLCENFESPLPSVSIDSFTGTSSSSVEEREKKHNSGKTDEKKPKVLPINIEDRSGPVTMTFQFLGDHLTEENEQALNQSFTPCPAKKPVPIVPFYQTEQKLCFDLCSAPHARTYNRLSLTHLFDRARSPASGPPPNPLVNIRAPRLKEADLSPSSCYTLSTRSITTGQSSISGSQPHTISDQDNTNKQKLPRTVNAAFPISSKLSEKETTKGWNNSPTCSKDNNISKNSPNESSNLQIQLSDSPSQYVNPEQRLSCLEEDITKLKFQSKAIADSASTLSETFFPNFHSPTPTTHFPTRPSFPPYDEPRRPSYIFNAGEDAPKHGSLREKKGFCESEVEALNSLQESIISTTQPIDSSYKQSSIFTSSNLANNRTNAGCSALTKASFYTNKINSDKNIKRCTTSATSAISLAKGLEATDNALLNASAAENTASTSKDYEKNNSNNSSTYDNKNSDSENNGFLGGGAKTGAYGATSAPKRGRGIYNKAVAPGVRVPLCSSCSSHIRGPFISALGRIWCPDHFICINDNCRRPLQDIGFVEEKGDLYCEYCFERYLAPTCNKCGGKIKGDCLNTIGKHFHPECFTCDHCGKPFGNTPFFVEDGNTYCEVDWNELFTTKCFACGFPVEAGDRWVEALNHNYHSQCFNCTYCKLNLEGQSFYNKGGRPFCKNHAR